MEPRTTESDTPPPESNPVARLMNGLIVSCPTHSADPHETDEVLLNFMHAAIEGGAKGLRLEGADFIARVAPSVPVPIIGFAKGLFEDGADLITPELEDIDRLFRSGASIVAVDVTRRKRPNGRDGFEFFDEARRSFSGMLCADVSNFREGVLAAELGADMVATTLSGYTAYTEIADFQQPDFELLLELQTALTIPVVAEGRIWTPDQAAIAIKAGAWAVVVGAAITKPRVLTEMFVHALRENSTAKDDI